MTIREEINLKFSSLNSVEVERATIKKWEWDKLQNEIPSILVGWLNPHGGYMSASKKELIFMHCKDDRSRFYGRDEVAEEHSIPVYVSAEDI